MRGEGRWVYYTSLTASLVCIITLACCTDVRRKFPVNFIFLGLFTVCEGLMLGTISSYYDVDAVLIAVGITAAVTLALTIFALQTKIDFTVCGGKARQGKARGKMDEMDHSFLSLNPMELNSRISSIHIYNVGILFAVLIVFVIAVFLFCFLPRTK